MLPGAVKGDQIRLLTRDELLFQVREGLWWVTDTDLRVQQELLETYGQGKFSITRARETRSGEGFNYYVSATGVSPQGKRVAFEDWGDYRFIHSNLPAGVHPRCRKIVKL